MLVAACSPPMTDTHALLDTHALIAVSSGSAVVSGGGWSVRRAGAVAPMQLVSESQRSLEVPYFGKQNFQINAFPIRRHFDML